MLSVLAIERLVEGSSEAGVGLGVPRNLAVSGLALLGGRGRDIRELAIFSLWTEAGRVLVGSVGGHVSDTLKLLLLGHAQLSLELFSGG